VKLLVIEDSPSLAALLHKGLTAEHHEVDVSANGLDGVIRAERGGYDAVILDVVLPDLDGLQVADRLRRGNHDVPILMLTARDTLHDRLLGFELGADDYLVKPFAFEELLARLRAITKRGKAPEDERLCVGDLVMDRRAHEVTRRGQSIHLTQKEFALLEYLMQHPGRALSRTMILDQVWDYTFGAGGNVLDVTIRRLRQAVDEGFDEPLILTVRGVGYKLKA
jgi:two-component system copper resistance phosphate regulon response regulator CusR